MTKESRKNKSYPIEFKEEAVALITEHGYSVTKAAESLGLRTNILYRWKQTFEDEKSGKRLCSEERQELTQLRRDNKRLKMEQAILKKASAYFASHMK